MSNVQQVMARASTSRILRKFLSPLIARLFLSSSTDFPVVYLLIGSRHMENKTVILPESGDSRIVEAALRLQQENIAQPILLGQTPAGTTLNWIDPATSSWLPEFAAVYAKGPRKVTEKIAVRLIQKPLYFAGMMVKTGKADLLVAGVENPSRRVMEAGQMTIGLGHGINTPSSFFLMSFPNYQNNGPRQFIFADCALNVEPTARELADIAMASAQSAAKLLSEPVKIAMLSFSSHGSAQHPKVELVRQALSLVKADAPTLIIDGELQVDTALSSLVAEKKLSTESPVAGQANVLIFPDLNAANIGYKIAQYFSDGQALGPILQGFSKPIADLSRGATVDDIVETVRILRQMA
jgi:phosphate acetyltransferase